MRQFRLFLFCAALLLPVARAAPEPPLCTVQAVYRPVSWPWFTPEGERLRRITVELKPGCPPDGVAYVRFMNPLTGRTLPERGFYTLTRTQPSLSVPRVFGSGVLPSWGAWWVKPRTGQEWQVPLTRAGRTP